MRVECDELSETMVGHETISLLRLMQDSTVYLQIRRQVILWKWAKRFD